MLKKAFSAGPVAISKMRFSWMVGFVFGACLLAGCARHDSPLNGIMAEFQVKGIKIVEQGFSDGTAGWIGLKPSIRVSTVLSDRPGGGACLSVSGSSPRGDWSYASSQSVGLLPSRTYRVGGWFRLNDISDDTYPLFLKIQIDRSTGTGGRTFVDNVNGPSFPLAWKGNWSHFQFQFTTAASAGLEARFYLEKGKDGALKHVDAQIDDISLELFP